MYTYIYIYISFVVVNPATIPKKGAGHIHQCKHGSGIFGGMAPETLASFVAGTLETKVYTQKRLCDKCIYVS